MKSLKFTFLLFIANVTFGQEQINFDFSTFDQDVRHLHGFLHGETYLESNPEGLARLEAANFKFWRSANNYDNHILADSLGFSTSLVISDFFANYKGGYAFAKPWLDWAEYELYVTELVNSTIINEISPSTWDVWNEPQSSEFWSGTLEQLVTCFEKTYTIIKTIDPSQKVCGPSIVNYNPVLIAAILDDLALLDIQLDAVSWHEFSIPDSLQLHVNQWHAMLELHPDWGDPEVHINEYSPRQTNQIPGWKVGWFYHLEKAKVDWANNACWDDMDDGTTVWNACNNGLNGILYYDNTHPLPLYWPHYYYGNMQGAIYFSTGSDNKSLGIGNRDGEQIKLLLGRYYAIKTGEFLFPEDEDKGIADVAVLLMNHGLTIGENYPITITKVPKGSITDLHLPLEEPLIVSESEILIMGDTITLNLPDFIDGEAYYITIGSPLSSINENANIAAISDLTIYPNPSGTGKFNIETGHNWEEDAQITVYDLQGKVVQMKNLKNAIDTELTIEQNGVYIVIIEDSNARILKKIIVNF